MQIPHKFLKKKVSNSFSIPEPGEYGADDDFAPIGNRRPRCRRSALHVAKSRSYDRGIRRIRDQSVS
ncbi:MAG: hypothetical protein ACPGQI_10470 [Gammaproteobacteria bacterium]